MEFQLEQVSQVEAILKGEIFRSEFESEKKKVAREIAKKVKIDGFRPGRVPPKLVEKIYADSIKEEALGNLINQLVEKGLKDIQPTINPKVTKLDETGKSFKVEIQIPLSPKVELDGSYIECLPKIAIPEVTEEEIKKELEQLAEKVGKNKPVEKESLEEGDIAVIDFKGFVNGKPFEGGEGEAYPLEIGSGQFIAGFEEQLKGMKVGEERTIEVTFPENYHEKSLAGKPATFKVTLQEIQEKKKAPIDDLLAQKVLNDNRATLDQLVEIIRSELQNLKKQGEVRKYKNDILDCFLTKFKEKVAVSSLLIEKEMETVIQEELSNFSETQLEQLKQNQEQLDQLYKRAWEIAEERVKLTLIIGKLVEKEEIKVKEDELFYAIYMEATGMGVDPNQLFKHYKENNLLPVVQMEVAKEKLIERLMDKVIGDEGEGKREEEEGKRENESNSAQSTSISEKIEEKGTGEGSNKNTKSGKGQGTEETEKREEVEKIEEKNKGESNSSLGTITEGEE